MEVRFEGEATVGRAPIVDLEDDVSDAAAVRWAVISLSPALRSPETTTVRRPSLDPVLMLIFSGAPFRST